MIIIFLTLECSPKIKIDYFFMVVLKLYDFYNAAL